jgi:hypothetical protein
MARNVSLSEAREREAERGRISHRLIDLLGEWIFQAVNVGSLSRDRGIEKTSTNKEHAAQRCVLSG